jgi:glycine/D-amino acid oxidase-like deaminating enzyme
MSVSAPPQPLPSSLWAATAVAPTPFPQLTGTRLTRVAIIGGGFTGLSTALHLAERGIESVVLEASEPGWGASGRNGGQVIPGVKFDPDALEEMFGPHLGPRMVRTVAGTASLVFDLVRRYDIACDALNTGWIQPAHSSLALATVQARARQWRRRGAEVDLLDRQQIVSLIGSQAYCGGWIDRRGGSVQPLSYARGLASTAACLGTGIFARSGVRRLRRDGEAWLLETETGEVRAEQVVVATNGYTDDIWPKLRQTVVPAYSLLVATKPLPEDLRGSILPGGRPASDTRRLLRYYRMDAHGRFVLGARGPMREQPRASDVSYHRAEVIKLFPQLKDVPFEFMWSGRVAMTADHLPHLHELAPGLHAGLGYNGRGVAMATMMGRLLAERISGVPAQAIDFPTVPLRPLPFHGWNRFAVRLLTQYYRVRDAVE